MPVWERLRLFTGILYHGGRQEMRNPHPAAFPVALIDRIVQSTTAAMILDPFVGSGTTAISALNFGRSFIGIDISPEYCALARERIHRHRLTLERAA